MEALADLGSIVNFLNLVQQRDFLLSKPVIQTDGQIKPQKRGTREQKERTGKVEYCITIESFISFIFIFFVRNMLVKLNSNQIIMF